MSARKAPFYAAMLATIATLALPACTVSKPTVGIVIDPPEAGLYLNGTRVTRGAKGVYEIDFSTSPRCYLQATAYGYEPIFVELTQRKVAEQVRQYGEFSFKLKQER